MQLKIFVHTNILQAKSFPKRYNIPYAKMTKNGSYSLNNGPIFNHSCKFHERKLPVFTNML